MALNTANVRSFGDITQAVSTAPIGATAPTAPLPTALPANWSDFGWVSDGGVTESKTFQETKKYGWQGGGILRSLRSQFENPFKLQALEENIVTMSLLRPGKAITTTAGTAEVQTAAFTGTGTAGTFALVLAGYGTATGLAFNVATTALATALNTGFGMTGITVTGTAGTTYTITFPAIYGNVPQVVAVNSITGVTAITVTTGTPGVATVFSMPVGTNPNRNLRQFAIDLVDGNIHRRLWFPTAEVTTTGDIVYSNTDLTVYEFTITPYPDGSGNFYYDLSDNPVLAGTFI